MRIIAVLALAFTCSGCVFSKTGSIGLAVGYSWGSNAEMMATVQAKRRCDCIPPETTPDTGLKMIGAQPLSDGRFMFHYTGDPDSPAVRDKIAEGWLLIKNNPDAVGQQTFSLIQPRKDIE